MKIFALKVIKKKMLQSDKDILSIKREKFVLRTLKDNPFIIANNLYFLMEYLSGGDIFHLMRRKLGFSESELKFYIAEIIIALELIHNDNVIYRDLKPENVMIGGDGHLKLVDFGFTK